MPALEFAVLVGEPTDFALWTHARHPVQHDVGTARLHVQGVRASSGFYCMISCILSPDTRHAPRAACCRRSAPACVGFEKIPCTVLHCMISCVYSHTQAHRVACCRRSAPARVGCENFHTMSCGKIPRTF